MLCAVCCTVYGVRVMGYLIIVSGALAVIQLNLLIDVLQVGFSGVLVRRNT